MRATKLVLRFRAATPSTGHGKDVDVLAVRIAEHGGPEVLTPVECPPPQPTGNEVLVRNSWIGVNFVDLQHREGSPYPDDLPLIPGTEAAGVVEQVGPDGDRDLIGQRVVHFGHLAGAYAELTAVPAAYVVPQQSFSHRTNSRSSDSTSGEAVKQSRAPFAVRRLSRSAWSARRRRRPAR